jgi:hypothetical protein
VEFRLKLGGSQSVSFCRLPGHAGGRGCLPDAHAWHCGEARVLSEMVDGPIQTRKKVQIHQVVADD